MHPQQSGDRHTSGGDQNNARCASSAWVASMTVEKSGTIGQGIQSTRSLFQLHIQCENYELHWSHMRRTDFEPLCFVLWDMLEPWELLSRDALVSSLSTLKMLTLTAQQHVTTRNWNISIPVAE